MSTFNLFLNEAFPGIEWNSNLVFFCFQIIAIYIEKGRERENVCVCVCVCERERERERRIATAQTFAKWKTFYKVLGLYLITSFSSLLTNGQNKLECYITLGWRGLPVTLAYLSHL